MSKSLNYNVTNKKTKTDHKKKYIYKSHYNEEYIKYEHA